MKRTERVGALIKILTEMPSKTYSLQYFCDLFGAAKSSISEDIQSASHAIELTGCGYLETTAGSKGGVRFVPDITAEEIEKLQADFSQKLGDPSRLLMIRIWCSAPRVSSRRNSATAAPTAWQRSKPKGSRWPLRSRICWGSRWSSSAGKPRSPKAPRSASTISAVLTTDCRRCPCPSARSRRAPKC